MEKGLYDRASTCLVDGKASYESRAYACTNSKEFFAELSVAYMWNMDESKNYNRTYPHNREQLRIHDSDSFHMIDLIWKMYEI